MSAEKLGVDYIDLFLIHWPNPRQDRYVDAFSGLVELLRGRPPAGDRPLQLQARARRARDRRDRRGAGRQPDRARSDVAREEPRAYHAGTASSRSRGARWARAAQLLAEPAIAEIAERHGRTPAQIVLRWHLQLGAVPIPKSANPARQAENLAVFDFALIRREMGRIASSTAASRRRPTRTASATDRRLKTSPAGHQIAMDPHALRSRRAGRLIDGIVTGAVEDELVQLHGSIVASLELFPVPDAVELVFDPALRMLTRDARQRATVAMGEHLPLYFGLPAADRISLSR